METKKTKKEVWHANFVIHYEEENDGTRRLSLDKKFDELPKECIEMLIENLQRQIRQK